jgi:hypothetical protein
MKHLLVAILLIAPIAAYAERSEFRDQYGNVIGASERRGNETEYRDRYGNYTGSSRDYGDRREYRDEYGNLVGSRDRDSD